MVKNPMNMTPATWALLGRFIDAGSWIAAKHLDHADENRARALHDRLFLEVDEIGRSHRVTEAGREAWATRTNPKNFALTDGVKPADDELVELIRCAMLMRDKRTRGVNLTAKEVLSLIARIAAAEAKGTA